MTPKSTPLYTSYQVINSGSTGFQTYLAPFLRHWPLFILSIGMALAGAYVYLLFKQPIYRIQASLLLQDEKRGSAQTNPLKRTRGLFAQKSG